MDEIAELLKERYLLTHGFMSLIWSFTDLQRTQGSPFCRASGVKTFKALVDAGWYESEHTTYLRSILLS